MQCFFGVKEINSPQKDKVYQYNYFCCLLLQYTLNTWEKLGSRRDFQIIEQGIDEKQYDNL